MKNRHVLTRAISCELQLSLKKLLALQIPPPELQKTDPAHDSNDSNDSKKPGLRNSSRDEQVLVWRPATSSHHQLHQGSPERPKSIWLFWVVLSRSSNQHPRKSHGIVMNSHPTNIELLECLVLTCVNPSHPIQLYTSPHLLHQFWFFLTSMMATNLPSRPEKSTEFCGPQSYVCL